MKNITNKRFGRLIALEPTDRRHDSKIIWKCVCDCGNICYVVSRSLVTGNTKSCGCLNRENLQRGTTTLTEGIAAFNQLYGNYKRQAKLRNYSFELSREEFLYLTTQPCFYCGEPPKQKQSGKYLNGVFIYNGIDRVDNTKGYELNNSVPCCGRCNRAKDRMSYDTFILWVSKIYDNLNLGTK